MGRSGIRGRDLGWRVQLGPDFSLLPSCVILVFYEENLLVSLKSRSVSAYRQQLKPQEG